jgi:hypothetical protein
MGDSVKGAKAPSAARPSRQRARTVLANRALLMLSLLAIALGVALGHTWITWLNATLL